MREIGAIEAEDKFGQLLDLVDHGEEVAITRDGREIARLVPATVAPDRDAAKAAIQRLRARAKQRKFGRFVWSEWKDYRDEGRP